VNGALETLQREMNTTRSGGSSELMDTLIAYWWKDMFKPFDQDPGEIEWQRAAALQPDEAVG
jgi:hypothetical protein